MSPTLLLVIEIVIPTLLHLAVIVAILGGQKRQPTATLAWILTVALLPFVGLFLYVLIGRTKTRRIVRRTRAAARAFAPVVERFGMRAWHPLDGLSLEERRTYDLIVLGERLSAARTSRLNEVIPLDSAAATYRAMIEAIDAAWHHVHILFYIIQPDGTGRSMRDRLAGCAARGVAVKVIVDAVLDNDPIEFMPCSSLCAIPMPFRFFGLSPIDLVMDLQVIRSTSS